MKFKLLKTASSLVLLSLCFVSPVYAWRSSLYPADWQPGFKDSQNRFLHDFSYAGYHKGEKPIPNVSGPVFNVVDYGANGSDQCGLGATSCDDTDEIQAAIDAAQDAGGGVVYLPEGTYFVTPRYYGAWGDRGGRPLALLIMESNVVVRGAGPGKTRIFYNDIHSRGGAIIFINPRIHPDRGLWEPNAFDVNKSDWVLPPSNVNKVSITQDLPLPTTTIPLATSQDFNVGDWVVIFVARKDNEPFLNYYSNKVNGYGFRCYRQITAVDRANNTITIDIPTRHPLYTEWQPKVYKTFKHLEEIGVENLSMAMRESTDLSYIGSSYLIYFKNTINSWARNINSYAPPQNNAGYGYLGGGAPEELTFHIHSYGIEYQDCRNLTIENCHLRNPQHHGDGGNGYSFIIQGSESLLKNCSGYNGRHNFSFKGMGTSGNVLYKCEAGFTPNYPRIRSGTEVNGKTLKSDFHMWLAHANLIDNFTLNGDSWKSEYRPCCSHYISATENVFWNTRVNQPHILGGEGLVSDQWGWGYVIGMQGAKQSFTLYGAENPGDPQRPDFYEPASLLSSNTDGQGATLEPQSLYLDQLARRTGSSPSPLPSPSPVVTTGDLNGDGQVNVFDLVIVGGAFGKGPGEQGYDARADANGSGGAIDILDLVVVGNNFGKL